MSSKAPFPQGPQYSHLPYDPGLKLFAVNDGATTPAVPGWVTPNDLVQAMQAAAAGTYTFVQTFPDAIWLVQHNLSRFPSVVIADSTGRQVEADVQFIDSNSLRINFAVPFAGTAYCN